MSTSAQSSIEGTVVAGKYQLVRLLGQGGMGAVYEGKNVATFKRCAVKLLLSAEFGGNAELVKRFFREAKASSIIESDHIVQVYDSGYDPELGWPYMVMEMLQGEDLEGLLKRVGAVQPLAAAKLVLQAAMGLSRAHEAGIVHRDIKPANLYLTMRETGELSVKLLDFGIAKVKMESIQETSSGLTRTGSMLGTPLYMSPEQVKGASNIDAASDVWSLGIVLFELLSGSIPWTNTASLGTLMAAIIHEDLPLLQDRAPWVPPELAEITHRAISRDAAKRFRNAGELRDALLQILPDGSRLAPEMLQPVAAQHRAFVAPRLSLSDDGMLRATTRSGLSANAATVRTPPKQSRTGLVLGLAATGLLLTVGGFVGYRKLLPAASSAVVSAQEPPPPTPVSAEPKSPGPVIKRFALSVAPAEVEVAIDGAPALPRSGLVEIEGAVGSTRRVRLALSGEQQDFVVAIADSGVVPQKIELPVKAAAVSKAAPQKPAAARGTPSPAPAKGAPAAPPKPDARAAVRSDTGLNRNVDEFGK